MYCKVENFDSWVRKNLTSKILMNWISFTYGWKIWMVKFCPSKLCTVQYMDEYIITYIGTYVHICTLCAYGLHYKPDLQKRT